MQDPWDRFRTSAGGPGDGERPHAGGYLRDHRIAGCRVRRDRQVAMAESSAADFVQPTDFTFDATSDAAIEVAVAKYPAGRQASAVIPLLDIAQRQMKRQTDSAWVPRVAMDAVAKRLAMPPIRVYEIATFYLMFNTRPVGKYHLQLCTTTPCWLRGSDDVVKACHEATGVRYFGETSADGL